MSAWPYPRALAHRGGGTLAPENTLAALDVGWQHGYRGAEIDAALSADGVPVLMHDATLERTTNARGPVDALSAAQLARLDAGSWFGAAFAGTPVPSLDQALQHCHARGIWLNVEIKPVPGTEARTGRAVAECVAAFVARTAGAGVAAPLLSSFSRVALAQARAAAPALARGLLCGAVPDDWQAALQELGCVSLHCDHRALRARMVQTVRAQGYAMLCYTVNGPRRAEALWRWGVDAVCTDRIDRIAALGAASAGTAPRPDQYHCPMPSDPALTGPAPAPAPAQAAKNR